MIPNRRSRSTDLSLSHGFGRSGFWDEGPIAELKAGVEQNRLVFEQVADGLARESIVPIRYRIDDVDVEATQSLRTVSRALAARGYLREQEGRFADAASDYLAILELGQRDAYGGLVVNSLVGFAIEYQGQNHLSRVCDQLDEHACSEIIEAIQRTAQTREPVAEVHRRERAWSKQAYGYIGHLTLLLEEDSDSLYAPVSATLAYDTNLTRQNLLLAAYGVRVHQLRNGEPPQSLSELTPEILSELPVDLLDPNQAPLRYILKPDGTEVLYSVGQDSVDNGGPATMGADQDPQSDDISLESLN